MSYKIFHDRSRNGTSFIGLDSSHLYCHPWQVRLSRLLQETKDMPYSGLLAVMIASRFQLTRQYAFTVHASLHPNTLWHGFKLVDVLVTNLYNGDAFVGWYPANTYTGSWTPSYQTTTQLLQEDLRRGSEPFGALTPEDLIWNKALLHLNWLAKHQPLALTGLMKDYNYSIKEWNLIGRLKEVLLTVGSDRT